MFVVVPLLPGPLAEDESCLLPVAAALDAQSAPPPPRLSERCYWFKMGERGLIADWQDFIAKSTDSRPHSLDLAGIP